jgi:hypothetical protein
MATDPPEQPSATQTDATMDRAELCYKLAERAWNRFKNRQDREYAIGLRIMSVFAIGAGVVIAARGWSAPAWTPWAGLVVAIFVVLGLVVSWLPFIHREHTHDRQQSIHWENEAIRIAELRPPAGLSDGAPQTYMGLHEVQLLQLGATILMAALFVLAICSKVPDKGGASGESRLTIESSGVDVDSKVLIKDRATKADSVQP